MWHWTGLTGLDGPFTLVAYGTEDVKGGRSKGKREKRKSNVYDVAD